MSAKHREREAAAAGGKSPKEADRPAGAGTSEVAGPAEGAGPVETAGPAETEVQQILEKVDREAKHRFLSGWQSVLVSLLAVSFSCFHIYTAFFGVLDAHLQRAVHLGFVLTLLYLLYPFMGRQRRDRFGITDLIPVLLSLGALVYLVYFYPQLVLRAGLINTMDVVVGTIGIVMVFEAARRIIGWPMVIIALVFILYAFFGEIMPDVLAHRNLKVSQIVNHLWFTTEGIFGIPLGVSSTFVFMFLLFAAFVESTGIGKLFIDLGNAVAGWASGGPAKVAVITSALEGTVEGSSVSNVVGSGSFTIPMMKKLGYGGAFAGAVEAAASTGGQLMPPIMGAAAFLMAEFLDIPYLEVAKAAAIPAVLYFAGIFAGVHLEAKKLGLKGMPRDQLVRFKTIIVEEGILLLPLVGIIYLLLRGFSLMRVALLATGLAIVAAILQFLLHLAQAAVAGRLPGTERSADGSRASGGAFLSFLAGSAWSGMRHFYAALVRGARSALGVGTACALAGVIVGVVTKTGAGLKLASGILSISQNNIYLTMFFTMITSIILGMGVPTTANYIITSTIAAPALLALGVVPVAAHLFVFYFGIIADLTPPVALAAYAGAAIARSNPMKTAVVSTRLAVGAFILPYIFVLNPQLLLVNATFSGVLLAVFTALLGMVCLSAALTGYLLDNLHWALRLVLLASGLMLLDPRPFTDVVGLAVVLAIGALQVILKRRRVLSA